MQVVIHSTYRQVLVLTTASNLYTTGVTNPGAAVGVIKFSVPFSAPNTLYYVCQNHSSMAGTIVVYPSI